MKTATIIKMMRWLMLSSVILMAACTNGYYQPGPTYYPSQSYPRYYYQDYYPGHYYEQDPQFWPLWQDRQGGGG